MVQFSYLIVCNNEANVKELHSELENFPDFFCAGTATHREDAINSILKYRPQIVFLDIAAPGDKIDITLSIITELHQYINLLPSFILLAENETAALPAIKAGAFDYLMTPLNSHELRKSLLKYQKHWQAHHYQYHLKTEEPDIAGPLPTTAEDKSVPEIQRSEIDIQICIKSYGDYQFIALKDVVYLEADNNTTDFYLLNGKKLSAYKTLKHYENNLPSFFFRIHNSYIVNSNHVSRINTGKQLCYLNNNEVSVSFSKTFKENIDTIIRTIAPEYL